MAIISIMEEIIPDEFSGKSKFGQQVYEHTNARTIIRHNLSLDQDIQVMRVHKDAVIPSYAKKGDAGFDLFAVEDTVVEPGNAAIIKTGLCMAIPEGFEMQIRMRSGASYKTPLIVANAPGTVDSGYRGEIGIIVRNLASFPYTVKKGDRIAQGVITPVVRATFLETDDLPISDRGSGGFGSTGSR